MLYRFVICTGIALLAYYVGREIGRAEPTRIQLNKAGIRRAGNAPHTEEDIPAN